MRVLLVHAFMGVWNERDACTRFGEAFSGCDARESPYTAVLYKCLREARLEFLACCEEGLGGLFVMILICFPGSIWPMGHKTNRCLSIHQHEIIGWLYCVLRPWKNNLESMNLFV